MLSILFCITKWGSFNRKLKINGFNPYRPKSPDPFGLEKTMKKNNYVKQNKAEKNKSDINNSTRLTQLSPHVN